jgi:hypothetical protein
MLELEDLLFFQFMTEQEEKQKSQEEEQKDE